MTNAIDGTILVWELTSGAFTKVDLSKVKDIEWDRKSCIYAWDTLGIWSKKSYFILSILDPDMKETDIN